MARGQRRGRRTDYHWASFGSVEADEDIGVAAQFGGAVLIVDSASTITRIRGKIGVSLNTAAVGESLMILLGIVIARTDVVQAPEMLPGTDDEASFLWQGQLYVDSGNEAAVNTNFLTDRIEVDTKAMRRVKPLEEVRLVFEAPAALAVDQAGTYDLTWYLHALCGS